MNDIDSTPLPQGDLALQTVAIADAISEREAS